MVPLINDEMVSHGWMNVSEVSDITSITVEVGHLCWVWIEEAFQISDEEEFNKLDLSIRGQLPEGYFKQITMTFNPWSENIWIKKRFFDAYDRIDRINDKGELRIIDYKTGKDNVKFKNIGDVVSNKDSGHYLAIMQLFLYCYALKNDANITNFDVSVGLQPIIYKIKDMGTSGITHDKNMITDLFSDENSGLCNEFLAEMAGVINDFFDKKVPFTQCENDKKAECKYCRFIEFCRR